MTTPGRSRSVQIVNETGRAEAWTVPENARSFCYQGQTIADSEPLRLVPDAAEVITKWAA